MLTTCRYCGRIHDSAYDCGRKPERGKKRGSLSGQDEIAFRRTEAWKQKSLRIRARDHFLCQICIRNLYPYGEGRALNYDGLSVHHAVPVRDAWERRLDDNNLLTLCLAHHEMAERGDIPVLEIQNIIREQQKFTE